MKITRYLMMFLTAAGLMSACQDLDETRTFAAEDVVAPVLRALPSEIVITPDNMGTLQQFAWEAADFGAKTQVNYSVEASMDGGEKLALFTDIAKTSTEQIYDAINTKLALATEFGGLGVPTGTPTVVDFFVSATIGRNFAKVYSAAVPVTVTVTAAERTYKGVWVIGDYCGWDFGKSQFLFDFAETETTYQAVVDFGEKAANGFKLTGAANWDNGNWGTDTNAEAPAPDAEAASIMLIDSGGSGNISVYSHRFYRFKFDRSTLTLTKDLSFDRLGVIGDATPTGWDGDTEMAFDAAKQRFWVDITLVDGGMKFRLDNDWAISWGSATAGKLDSGDNISVTAGDYRIYVNINNPDEMTYELSAADYGKTEGPQEPEPVRADWYLHGQTVATPDWGETAFEGGKDIYKLTGVEVAAASQFLFKTGDEGQWIGPAATLGADPYSVTVGKAFATSADKINGQIDAAGTYDYWFLPRANEAYVMKAGEMPFFVADTWGLVGTINDWGGAGDMAMTTEGDYLVRKGVFLATDSQFKIRFDNAWDDTRNYGLEVAGTLEPNTATAIITSGGSNNMSVSVEGLYDIYFDLVGEQVWIMTAGTKPAR